MLQASLRAAHATTRLVQKFRSKDPHDKFRRSYRDSRERERRESDYKISEQEQELAELEAQARAKQHRMIEEQEKELKREREATQAQQRRDQEARRRRLGLDEQSMQFLHHRVKQSDWLVPFKEFQATRMDEEV